MATEPPSDSDPEPKMYIDFESGTGTIEWPSGNVSVVQLSEFFGEAGTIELWLRMGEAMRND